MARKKFNVVTIAAMVAILAIGAMGVGYAFWTDSLSINATAGTGTLNVNWTAMSADDNDDALAGGGICSANYDSTNTSNLILESSNMYPGYSCTISVTATNVGTLPVNVAATAPVFTGDSGVLSSVVNVNQSACSTVTSLAPGASTTCAITLSIPGTVADSSVQGKTATMSATLNFTQTNAN